MRFGLIGGVCVAALAIGACGGGDDVDATTATTAAAAVTTAAGAAGGVGGTGNCQADLDGIMEYVDAGVSPTEFDAGQAADFGLLVAAAGVDCSPEEFAEFASNPEVAAFLALQT